MRVILKENIENLGKKGDLVDVAPGYGRNYLIPKNLALEVTPTNLKMIEMQQQALQKGLEKEMESHRALIDQLNEVTLTFPRKAGEKDAIFGSVSTGDVRDALEKLDFDIEKKKILLDEPIKKLGNYSVAIKVFHDEKAEIKVAVVKEEKTEEKEKRAIEQEKEEPAAPLEEKKEIPSEEKTKAVEALEEKGTEEQESEESIASDMKEKVSSEKEKKTSSAKDKADGSK